MKPRPCDQSVYNVSNRVGKQSQIARIATIGAGSGVFDKNGSRGKCGHIDQQRSYAQSEALSSPDAGRAGRRICAQHNQRKSSADDLCDDEDLHRQHGLNQSDGEQSDRDSFVTCRRSADAYRESEPAANRKILCKPEVSRTFENDDRGEWS